MELTKTFKKYYSFSKIAQRELFAYPANLIGRIVIHIFRIVALGFIYTYLYSKGNTDAPINLVESVWALSLVQIIYQGGYNTYRNLRDTIHSGSIEVNLNKPYSVLTSVHFSAIGDVPIKMALLVIATLLTLIPIWGIPEFTPLQLVFIMISAPLGIFLNILLEQFMALFTFWVENPDPIYWILTKISWLFSGTFIPLALLPVLFKNISTFIPLSTPFYVGRVFEIENNTDFFFAVGLMLLWLILFYLINNIFYNKSLKKVSINGG